MRPPTINDRELLRLIDKDKLSQTEAAKQLNVSRQAVSKRLQELRGKTTRVVAVKKIDEIVSRKIDAVDQLQKINEHAHWLLDHVMKWVKGDETAIQVLEKNARLVNVGTKEDPEFVKEYKFKDPHEIALKSMHEIRGQLELQLKIFQTLYDMKAVQEFQEEVLAAIGDASPDARARIINNLNKRRVLRAAIKFN